MIYCYRILYIEYFIFNQQPGHHTIHTWLANSVSAETPTLGFGAVAPRRASLATPVRILSSWWSQRYQEMRWRLRHGRIQWPHVALSHFFDFGWFTIYIDLWMSDHICKGTSWQSYAAQCCIATVVATVGQVLQFEHCRNKSSRTYWNYLEL